MKRIILGLMLTFSVMKMFAGSSTAVLTCQSKSGKTKFVVYIQDIVGLLESAEFTIDSSTIKFSDNDRAFTVFDPSNGVFTIFIDGKSDSTHRYGKFVQFWAIPSTFKTINKSRVHQIYEFNAKVRGTEPRPNKEWNSPEIELICRLEYEI